MLFLVFAMSFSLFGQEAGDSLRYKLTGRIINKSDNSSVSYAHILLKNQNRGTAADIYGIFSIRLNHSDTVTFSAVGYEDYELTYSNLPYREEVSVIIDLKPSVECISEVNVFPFKTYSQFKSALLTMELPEEPLVDPMINFREIAQGAVDRAKAQSGGSIVSFSPITLLYNRFSKEGKAKREYARLMAEDHLRDAIAERYNADVVRKATSIEDETILKAFMKYCKLEDDFLLYATEYEILYAINECYKDFSCDD